MSILERETNHGGIYMRTIVNDSTLGIVDNDPLVASAIQSLLVETCAPIQILWTVTSAEQALEAMRDSAQRPQAVLTDIAMPGDERLGISASYQGTTSRYCRHWYQRLFG